MTVRITAEVGAPRRRWFLDRGVQSLRLVVDGSGSNPHLEFFAAIARTLIFQQAGQLYRATAP